MDEHELLRHRVLYLLLQGYINPERIAELLDLDRQEIVSLLKELNDEGTIKIHTVH